MRALLLTLLLAVADATHAETPRWYVVLFTVDGCHFCEMMRERVIKPMIATGDLPPQQFYEINMTDKGEWFYFDPMDAYLQKRDLYRKYDLGLFPTTVILNGRAELISPKLVGITTPEKFQRQLTDALQKLEAAP
ncbi:thioredoxin fold domain-containing protein [Sulfurivirga sp.]|uniref:thioredoxin fold domain-containing protein n=1 Tax=Sulfurivirga sp. TaxID=2614236 RepID=UPI0025DD7C82|nr:thioredoxin fold domain-containing protein [Sulfurivirga sp.]